MQIPLRRDHNEFISAKMRTLQYKSVELNMGSVVVDIQAISESKSTDRAKRFQFQVRTGRCPDNLDLFYMTARVGTSVLAWRIAMSTWEHDRGPFRTRVGT